MNSAEIKILETLAAWVSQSPDRLRKEGYCRTKEGKLVSPVDQEAYYFSMDARLELELGKNFTGDLGQRLQIEIVKILKESYGYYSIHEAGWKLSPQEWSDVLIETLKRNM